jgi:hypothetical protein
MKELSFGSTARHPHILQGADPSPSHDDPAHQRVQMVSTASAKLDPPEGFETVAEAKRRRAAKIRILANGTPEEQQLGVRLSQSGNKFRYKSGACDISVGLFRLWLYRRALPILSARPHWTRASVIPAGFLIPYGELTSVDLQAIAKVIDKRLERSSLRNRIIIIGIDISLNVQDNKIVGWQLHLYLLIEGEDSTPFREAIKAAFPPEPTADEPYKFKDVTDAESAITYLFKSIFNRRSCYRAANGRPRTSKQSLKGPDIRELMVFLDRFPIGARLILRGLRQNGKRLTLMKRNGGSSS